VTVALELGRKIRKAVCGSVFKELKERSQRTTLSGCQSLLSKNPLDNPLPFHSIQQKSSLQALNLPNSKAKVVVLQVLPCCSRGEGKLLVEVVMTIPQKFTLANPLYAIPCAPAIRAPRTRSQQPNSFNPPHHSTCLHLALAKHTITIKGQDDYEENCVREDGARER
jgi:hypothetical protein